MTAIASNDELEHGQTTPLRRRRGFLRSLLRFILFFSVAILIYGLSLGPAYLALRKQHIQQATFNRLYDPIVHPALKNPTSNYLMFWYLSFWYDDAKEVERGLENQLKTNGFTVEGFKPVGSH